MVRDLFLDRAGKGFHTGVFRSEAWSRPREWARQYDFRAVRLTSGALRGLASSRPEPPVLLAQTSGEVSHGRV
jgi:hypothetical protein